MLGSYFFIYFYPKGSYINPIEAWVNIRNKERQAIKEIAKNYAAIERIFSHGCFATRLRQSCTKFKLLNASINKEFINNQLTL